VLGSAFDENNRKISKRKNNRNKKETKKILPEKLVGLFIRFRRESEKERSFER